MSDSNSSSAHYRRTDIFILVALAALVAWYALDAYQASAHVANLILIAPVAGLTLALCIMELFRGRRRPDDDASTDASNADAPMMPALIAMGCFAGYVLTLEWLGFDVGTFLFISAFLYSRGERRWRWLFAYSLTFALFVALFFASMLPYPMPMLILPSAY